LTRQAGYREGITAGKEAALQEGFDTGFAQVGAPLGRELGLLRGLASALQSYLSTLSPPETSPAHVDEARYIAKRLSEVRFSDIVPRDLEAEQHAREHLEIFGDEVDENEELAERRRVEQLEDMMSQLTAGDVAGRVEGRGSRPDMEEVRRLKQRLEALWIAVGLDVDPQWS